MFDDSDKVSSDVVLLNGYPRNCMPYLEKGLLEVYEDIVEFFTGDGDISHRRFLC